MSQNNYRISRQAIRDLENIWLYTYRNWSKAQADKYYASIISGIEFIGKNTICGKSVDHLRKHYRVFGIKSHLIFYKRLNAETVEIVRILHNRMDVESYLE